MRRVLLIGYPMRWHHSQYLKKYLEENYEVTFMNGTVFDKYYDTFLIPAKYDYVLMGQLDGRVMFTKEREKTKIISYCGEAYWSPGAINPDYLITCFPELIARFKKNNPEIFHFIRKYREMSLWIEPEEFQFDTPKILKGIYYEGHLKTLLGNKEDRNGGGHFRLYREAYAERREIILSNPDLITYLAPSYNDEYSYWLVKTEANLVAHAYLSYFAKRELENCSAGSINIFYIRDEFEEQYLNEYGFYDMVNCVFVKNRQDLKNFYTLKESVKESIRINALDLVKERYTTKIVWDEIFKWVNEDE